MPFKNSHRKFLPGYQMTVYRLVEAWNKAKKFEKFYLIIL
jgi:hypothetical protein